MKACLANRLPHPRSLLNSILYQTNRPNKAHYIPAAHHHAHHIQMQEVVETNRNRQSPCRAQLLARDRSLLVLHPSLHLYHFIGHMPSQKAFKHPAIAIHIRISHISAAISTVLFADIATYLCTPCQPTYRDLEQYVCCPVNLCMHDCVQASSSSLYISITAEVNVQYYQ